MAAPCSKSSDLSLYVFTMMSMAVICWDINLTSALAEGGKNRDCSLQKTKMIHEMK